MCTQKNTSSPLLLQVAQLFANALNYGAGVVEFHFKVHYLVDVLEFSVVSEALLLEEELDLSFIGL